MLYQNSDKYPVIPIGMNYSALHHLDSLAAAFLCAKSTCVAQGIIDDDLATQRLVLISDVYQSFIGTGLNSLADFLLSRALAFVDDWFHFLLLSLSQFPATVFSWTKDSMYLNFSLNVHRNSQVYLPWRGKNNTSHPFKRGKFHPHNQTKRRITWVRIRLSIGWSGSQVCGK
jgi:hypothetical protein